MNRYILTASAENEAMTCGATVESLDAALQYANIFMRECQEVDERNWQLEIRDDKKLLIRVKNGVVLAGIELL